MSVRPDGGRRRVLLLRAYQPFRDHADSPPLGLLYLVTALRRRFGDSVDVEVVDMRLHRLGPDWLEGHLAETRPDVVGVSAMNCESGAAHDLADCVARSGLDAVSVLGGPYAHKRAGGILDESAFDWVMGGECDHTFPEALARHFAGAPLGDDLPGLSYRRRGQPAHVGEGQDTIEDLDALGFPAWDLVDFDAYARVKNMAGMLRAERYATVFTSRGCPYLCSYCHDIFGKRFRWRSAEHVMEELTLLREQHGVDEFQIVDDIFNLNRPRLRHIMGECERRWRGEVGFTFPNGVRADIMDEGIVDALSRGGTYLISIAIETVTPRLQALVQKNLDVERAKRMIDFCDERRILTRGFFMLGFPTESPEELRATVRWAIESRLTLAYFFTVVPQPGTPLFDLAREEDAVALEATLAQEREAQGYRADASWFQRAYGIDLARAVRGAYARFYLRPSRIPRILTRMPRRAIASGVRVWGSYVFRMLPRPRRRAAPPVNDRPDPGASPRTAPRRASA